MKFRNKGRKIYKTKEKNYYGKSPAGKAFSIGLSILLIGGIGFIGYSVAEPIVNYTKKKGDDNPAVSSEITTQSGESTSDSIQIPTASGSEAVLSHQKVNFENYCAAAVKETDLLNADTLKLAIKRLPTGQNIQYLEVPLKVKGGRIYYSSGVYYAISSQAFQEMMSLDQIVEIIKDSGYKPVAVVSTFNDNLLPVIDGEAGYVTADTGEQWIDNDYEAGGKPWTTPYSQVAVNYINSIVDEISAAGFEKVVCSDFVFPHFRQSDLDMLPDELSDPSRAMALTAAANLFNNTILSNESAMFIEVSSSELLQGYSDILQPMLLNVNTVILNIDLDEISYGVYTDATVYEFSGKPADKAEKMIKLVEDDLDEFNVAVRLSGSTVNMSELLEARDKLVELGYSSFVIG